MPIDGEYGSLEGPLKPSSEWRFHLDIMRARPEIGAIVHTHSTYATIIAITRREIPACHYMIAAFGGSNIRCAPYARYGTANFRPCRRGAEGPHGLPARQPRHDRARRHLDKAMWHAVELETLARQYYHSLLIGGPVILTDEQIAETAAAMKGYGYAPPAKPARKAKA